MPTRPTARALMLVAAVEVVGSNSGSGRGAAMAHADLTLFVVTGSTSNDLVVLLRGARKVVKSSPSLCVRLAHRHLWCLCCYYGLLLVLVPLPLPPPPPRAP